MAARSNLAAATDPPPPPVLGTFIITHRIEFPQGVPGWVTPADLDALEQRIMSKLSDKLDALEAAQQKTDDEIKAAVQRNQEDAASFETDLASLHDQIAALQKQIDEGTASPADLDRFDRLVAKEAEHAASVAALDARKPDVLPEPAPPEPLPPA